MYKRGQPIVFIGIIIIIISFFASADTDSTLTDEQLERMLQENPTAAFSSEPIRAWEAINSNPNLMTDTRILDAAFENDIYAAGRVLNQNPYLLSDANIVARFEEAAQSPAIHSLDVNGNPSNEFLNSNPEATRTWLEQKYQLRMENGASFLEYNGVSLTTRGAGSTTFNINDFPSATINRDGSLTHQHTTFKSTTALAVNPANGQVQMTGGEARATGEATIHLEATNGVVYLGRRGSITSYEGSFILSQENGAVRASSREGQEGFIYTGHIRVTGTIIRPPHTSWAEFIVDGNAVLNQVVRHEFGEHVEYQQQNVLRIQSTSQVYFSQQHARGEATFCQTGFTCIIDASRGFDPKLGTRFAVIGMTHNDEIMFRTPAYYEHVEVINAQSGQVTFDSVSAANPHVLLGRIVVGSRDEIGGQGNSLEHINAGRIDVLYPENPSCTGESCRQILHHWSSNEQQKDTSYFQAAHNNYVGRQVGGQNALLRCTLGVDCEENLARNFGKVIGVPAGGTARTTIIVAGDNTDTARSLEQWCGGNGGCYILNSRDVSPTTHSQNLVITGHHYQDNNYVWRDPSSNPDPAGGHNPTDAMYFSAVEAGSPFDHLPTGNSIESITFSACNTVLRTIDETDESFQALRNTYLGLQQIQGWTGTARLQEEIEQLHPRISAIPSLQQSNIYPGQTESHGQRAWFIRDEENRDRWFWTKDGTTCVPVVGGGGQQECPVQAIVAQR